MSVILKGKASWYSATDKGGNSLGQILPADSAEKQEIAAERFNNIASEFKSVDNVDDIPF